MSTLRVLQQLPGLFRYADVQKFTGNANTFLSRALKAGLIERLARSVYINSAIRGVPQIEEAACFIRTPCYISCEWALNHHGITIQSPTVCTVLTLSSAVGEARRLVWRGTGIEFSRIADRLFNGFTMLDGFSMATPEKALLDTAYFRKGFPVRDELELDKIDRVLIGQMALAYPKRVQDDMAELIR